MRKNTFLKSALRQPLRTLVLMLLIGVAAFAFVLRAVEYMVVDEQITEISFHYRAIGALQATRDNPDRNATMVANILTESPFVRLDDRRFAVEGLLVDLKNAHILPPA